MIRTFVYGLAKIDHELLNASNAQTANPVGLKRLKPRQEPPLPALNGGYMEKMIGRVRHTTSEQRRV